MSHPDSSPLSPSDSDIDCPDIVCFSHLRWDFVFQRPQHLLTRCARTRRVFYFEEPIIIDTSAPRIEIHTRGDVVVLVPHLPAVDVAAREQLQRVLVNEVFAKFQISTYVLWYYTPMAVALSDHLKPVAVVYDCMDELSAFKGAAAQLKQREALLMQQADLVLTGGQSLYEAKRSHHDNIHLFPSSVDVNHFAAARTITTDPPDQAAIPHPRLGYFGVIDERMDIELLRGVAESRPEWHLVMLGPVVKIDPATLPARPNIHYLGSKRYAELPSYIAGWEVALLPFARNEATRFISPTKTPEYLSAGKPVVSTSIRDVVRPYGQKGLVRIADDVSEFGAACEASLNEDATARIRRGDAFLRQMSWDGTWTRIQLLLDAVIEEAATPGTGESLAEAI